jgi:hypothetical protein
MKNLNSADYDSMHEEEMRRMIKDYPTFGVDEIGKNYAQTRISVERNSKWRNESTILITSVIARSNLEGMLAAAA